MGKVSQVAFSVTTSVCLSTLFQINSLSILFTVFFFFFFFILHNHLYQKRMVYDFEWAKSADFWLNYSLFLVSVKWFLACNSFTVLYMWTKTHRYSRHSLSRHRFIWFSVISTYFVRSRIYSFLFLYKFCFYLDFSSQIISLSRSKVLVLIWHFALFSYFYGDVWKDACELKGVNNLLHVVKSVIMKSINSELFANPCCWIPDCLFHSACNWQVSKLSDQGDVCV